MSEIDPIDEALKNIDKKLEEKFRVNDERFSSLSEELKTIKNAPEEKAAPKAWETHAEDDDSYITKADLKNVLKDALGDIEVKSRNIARTVVDETTQKFTMDAQVFVDFPEANKNSSSYDPDFLKQVEAEMMQKINRGRKAEDSDLFYDAAERIWSKWVRQGRALPKHLVVRNNEERNARDDNFDVSESAKFTGAGPSARQIEMARKVGMSKERLIELSERNKKNN